MNEEMIRKLESPLRVSELDPENTLNKAGFRDGMTICDIGAGTGVFTFAAAASSSGDIYALDISEAMVEYLNKRRTEKNALNVKVIRVTSDNLPVPESVCDMAVMSTVLHELKNKDLMLLEIKRILKNSGKLLIIDWHKRETPIGPPLRHRLSDRETEMICLGNGFLTVGSFLLGENFYALLFEPCP